MRLYGVAALVAVALTVSGTSGSAQGFLHKLGAKAKAAAAAERDSIKSYGRGMRSQARSELNDERDSAQAYVNGLTTDAQRKADSLAGRATEAVTGPNPVGDSTASGPNGTHLVSDTASATATHGASGAATHRRAGGTAGTTAVTGQSQPTAPTRTRHASRGAGKG